MTIVQLLVTLLIGIVAGVASGMFGIGGGVVIVPALTVILGFGLQQAVGTSLGALMLPVGIFAVLAYYRAGMLRLSVAAPVAIGLLISTTAGAQLALNLPGGTLAFLYGIFLLYNSWRFAEPRQWWARLRQQTPPPAASVPAADPPRVSMWALLAVGLVAGIFSGLFGIGGGLVIVPALVSLLRMDQKEAVATSLGALLLPVAIGGVISYYQQGQLDVPAAATIAVGLAVGAFGGAKIALGLPSATVKRLYGVFLFFVALRFIGVYDWFTHLMNNV